MTGAKPSARTRPPRKSAPNDHPTQMSFGCRPTSRLWYCNCNGKGTESVKSWMFAQKSAQNDNVTPMSFAVLCLICGIVIAMGKPLNARKVFVVINHAHCDQTLRTSTPGLGSASRSRSPNFVRIRSTLRHAIFLCFPPFTAPPIGRFWPNLVQSPRLRSETIVPSLMLIAFILRKLCKNKCFLAN